MTSPSDTQQPAFNPRTRMLLDAPILQTLLRLAWPNVLVMLAQASTGLIETWWVSHLGTAALTGMAVVFPGFMMMQMLSGGAIGGGISSAVARALGGGRRADANSLVLHAVVINLGFGILASVLFLAFGRPLYHAMGAEGPSLDAAMTYSNVVFGGNVLVWLMNALASVIRGTGNMLVPSIAVLVNVILLIPLSPLLIFGYGPLPALGIAGGGVAVLLTTVIGIAILAGYIWSAQSVVRFMRAKFHRDQFVDILNVGGVGAVNTLQSNLTVILVTALVGAAGGTDAVAGYGTGARLEYLLVPLTFGFGGPLVALVGTNIGAGQKERALRIAIIGSALSFAVTEIVGLTAAIWPQGWLGLFGSDPAMIATGSHYLRIVGPAYGFYGVGLALYFASQGAGRLGWPLAGSLLRLIISVGGGWLALRLGGSLSWLFAALTVALVIYGSMLAIAVASGVWFSREKKAASIKASAATPATILTAPAE